ncbi:2,3-diaminopropionate biosynthesis protein SbnB [Micromonospora sp. NBC_01813]|uniref:2,3-diaminopropionate biosynthesis protein SbnB n=1 Tax=Micromonospora sp. NBC_01813 TaxID=2975988 RepID=UPI002DDB7D75|nr:2,3-diaminopropionate biosynthesis protein SbnB [Micromonospora sp. NBC_01813]WSA08962.1 2,3-diaminopropionate biosynthesis protein SbnB [Micromonospora sp. NBC_01813]
MSAIPPFSVISGAQVHDTINGREPEVTELIETAYRLHGDGETTNPDSYFLRFPDRPTSRIIALPASVRGKVEVHGMKWISSFPDNVANGIPRASAVLILNDYETGYPIACLESSIISAARTAASAALAALALSAGRGGVPRRVGYVGTGFIARYIHTYLVGNGCEFDSVGVYDVSAAHAAGFREHLARGQQGEIELYDNAEDLVRAHPLIVFATVAGRPHLADPRLLAHNPLVLHVSLRDLAPEIIRTAVNVVDDVEHCMKADTSVHLTEQQLGHRGFVDGTLYDVLTGGFTPPVDRPVVFSPFGLGVLDLVLARHIHASVAAAGRLHTIPGFFHDVSRYG